MHFIAPSMLSADFANLREDIELVNRSEADWFHLDVMDGVFVPNISFGLPVISAIRKHARKPLDVHLMIVSPERYFRQFRDAGADILTVHYEASTHLHRSLQAIRSLGMKAGVALNPHTPVELLSDILAETDLVLVMSVNPGFGGQTFIPQSIQRIQRLHRMIREADLSVLIEVDGGVGPANAEVLITAGADVLVAGNAIFGSGNPGEIIHAMKISGSAPAE